MNTAKAFVRVMTHSYQSEAQKLIDLAQPADRYIFTQIRYRCPGVQEDQMGETLSVELW